MFKDEKNYHFCNWIMDRWLDEWEAFGKGGVKELDEFLAHKKFIFNNLII